ncbi:hypothetical protein AAC691_10210 [Nguyenibacter vanlangensis]|uniref:Uncharacterized protein n=3 Tax=Nguyenibacter TaxID=1519186 RepID=A0ABZ3DBG6_9PROT|nr:hypothetical protein [Nguyenibacter vanlangensis]
MRTMRHTPQDHARTAETGDDAQCQGYPPVADSLGFETVPLGDPTRFSHRLTEE